MQQPATRAKRTISLQASRQRQRIEQRGKQVNPSNLNEPVRAPFNRLSSHQVSAEIGVAISEALNTKSCEMLRYTGSKLRYGKCND